MSEIAEVCPTGEWRWHQPSEYEPPRLQWRYWARCRDGSEGFFWRDVPPVAG